MLNNNIRDVEKEWFTKSGGIQGKEVYKDLAEKIIQLLDQESNIIDVINWMKQEVCEKYKKNSSKKLTDGALNNCSGAWNEYIAASYLTHFCLKFNESSKDKIIVITNLPPTRIKNGETATFLKLFQSEEFEAGKPLSMLNDIRNRIFFPSPDLVVLSVNEHFYTSFDIDSLLKKQEKAPYESSLYKKIEGTIQSSNVRSIASLKTSYRPDRRYQPLFETAMLKAITYGLEQNWRYYMIASKVSKSDEILFENLISPHGIVLKYLDIKNTQSRFVDNTYIYSDKKSLLEIFSELAKR
ncbi:hypothetical protein FEK30_01870 [Picosynechococcus sp. PCC 11901]|uniref:Cfr10I/Bse634I family restriction endonuclease n=1 Tax=Picosynechococcus sp. PCC 11901 TaxID=2579791 RepID=UPI0010FBF991|nr:Cfr10I/Bse634I family restriction endonuclease [Picosynechococcus sp. PCC 11901]QCS48281.1 hypothetical protein FEK30_01870 [Picosynechococcus sp. PCC 11901]